MSSLGSFEMNSFGSCSNGSRMFTPKLRSRPAPSWHACMMPCPAPVMTMKPAAVIRRANSCAVRHGAEFCARRAEPNTLTLRTARYGVNILNA